MSRLLPPLLALFALCFAAGPRSVVAEVGGAADPDSTATDAVRRAQELMEEPASVDLAIYGPVKDALVAASREDVLATLVEVLLSDWRARGRWHDAAELHCEAGVNFANLHRFTEATAQLDSSLAALDRAPTDDPSLRGMDHMYLAAIHRTLDDLESAARHLEQGQEILREHLRPGGLEWGQASIIAAGLVNDLHGEEAGIEAYLDFLDQLSGLEESLPILEAWAHHDLGSLYMEVYRFVEAEEEFRRALELRRQTLGPDDVFAGTTHHEIARARRARGDFRGARTELQRALEVYESQQERPDWVYVGARQDLADLHLWTGDPGRCVELTREAMETAESLPARYPERARFWLTLGRVHLERDEATAAVEALERGLEEESSRDRPSARRIFRLRFALASARAEKGEREQAGRLLEALADDLARQLPEAGALAARVELRRALLTGDEQERRRAADRALEALEEALPGAHPDLVAARVEVARHRAREGDAEGAWGLAGIASEEARALLRDAAQVMTEEHALLFSAELRRSLSLRMAALCERGAAAPGHWVDETFESVLRGRGLVLSEMARRNGVTETLDDPQAQAARDALASARADLAQLTLFPAASDSSYAELLEAARRRRERAEIRWAGFAADDPSTRGMAGLDSLWRALPDSAALVSFVRWQDLDDRARYSAFVAEKQGARRQLRHVDLGAAETIDATVIDYDRHVERALRWLRLDPGGTAQQSRALLEAVAERVWRPLGLDARACRRIWLVLDGKLHRLPFAALPGREREFLSEELEVLHRLGAERDLLRAPSDARGQGMLLVGGVDYDSSAEASRWRSLEVGPFAPLPGSKEEVEAIARLVSGREGLRPELRTGREATESAVRAGAPGRRILHLATHGFHAPSTDPRRFDTLLRSGVVLAGANRPDGAPRSDGLLTAKEIAALPLSGMEWAVVSACDSGAGEAWPGEGVIGLQRALRAAGVGTLITSLWSLEDRVARRFVEPLYRHHLLEDRSTARSMQEARHEILRFIRSEGRSAHPLRWAGFVALGEWR